MMDYLNNLLFRAALPEEGVLPRPAARFLSQSASDAFRPEALDPIPEEVEDAPAQETAPRRVARSRTTAVERDARHPEPAPEIDTPPAGTTDAAPAFLASVERRETEVADASPRSTAYVADVSTLEPELDTEPIVQNKLSHVSVATDVRREQGAAATWFDDRSLDRPETPTRSQLSPRSDSPSFDRSEALPRFDPALDLHTSEAPPTSDRLMSAEIVPRRGETDRPLRLPSVSSPLAVDAPATAEQRVVHVTIGRVEIRAHVASPPAANRRAAREGAAPTLDEYLNGSRRGKAS